MKYGKKYLNEKLLSRMNQYGFKSPCLEVGCGTGDTLIEILKVSAAQGIDLSNDAIAQCHHKGLPAKKADLFDITEKFNAVICLDVIEHVQDDAAFCRRLYTILNPGGKGCIVVPSGHMKQDDVFFGHYRRYSKTEILTLLTNAGFAIEHAEMLGHPFFSWARALANLTYPRTCAACETPEMRTLKSSYEHPFDNNILSKILAKIESSPILGKLFLKILRIQDLFGSGNKGVGVMVIIKKPYAA